MALASPTSLFLSFPDGPHPDLHLERVEPGATDLGRLVELEALARSVASGSISAREGLQSLERQRSQRPLWGSVQQASAFALAALAASIFFGSPLVDAAAAALLGLGVGCACIWSRPCPGWARLLEPLAAMATTLGALALAHQGWISAPESVALAALIVLVPGYDLTVALFEMAQRHLTSGTTRLFGALGSFLGLGLGLGLGRLVGSELLGAGASFPPLAQPAWAILPALLATPLAFGVLLQLHPGHLVWATLGGLVAFFGARLGSGALGPEFGAGAGAFLLGAVANLVARWAGLPAAVTLVPGILLLVPGSVGFHSVAQFLQHDPVAGVEAAFHMALVGTALVGGLLAAHALLPPRAQAPSPRE